MNSPDEGLGEAGVPPPGTPPASPATPSSPAPAPAAGDAAAAAADAGNSSEAAAAPARGSARYLAAIIESSDDAIVSKTLDGIVRTWNNGAERIFGYSAEEMVGRPIQTIIPPDRAEEEPQILARLRRGERVDHFETVRVRKDGRQIEVSVTISPIRDSDRANHRRLQDRPRHHGAEGVPAATAAGEGSRRGRQPRQGPFPQRPLPRAAHAAHAGARRPQPDGAARQPDRRDAQRDRDDPPQRRDRGAAGRRPARPHAHQPREDPAALRDRRRPRARCAARCAMFQPDMDAKGLEASIAPAPGTITSGPTRAGSSRSS